MEFGKIEDICDVNWTLPSDDPKNERINGKVRNPQIYFGSPAWANRTWRGKIYPQGISPEKFLYFYSRQFNCIELNTTHYRIPSKVTTEEWLSSVPSHFQFCPKLHKEISHSWSGMMDKKLLKEWLDFIESLKGNLGPCFIQFHEKFSYEDKMLLFRFLESWPSEFKLTLEFRHSSWFSQNKILPALTDYLHKKQMGLVITDVAGRRDVLHTSLSANWTMIRLIGNDLHESDSSRLRDWSIRLRSWKEKGLEKAYLFLHQPDDVWTIEFAQLAHKIFSQEGHPEVPRIEFAKERDLFNL